jgi:hypothetical protein
MSNKQFYGRVKGPMNNYEDWYSYSTDNGVQTITHSWCHVSPSLESNQGTKTYTLEEFQKSIDVSSDAKVALDKALKEE